MAKPNRTPMHVSPQFKKKLHDIQEKIMRTHGIKKPLTDIAEDIISSPMFNEIEKNILKSGDIKLDLKIRLDRRFLE